MSNSQLWSSRNIENCYKCIASFHPSSQSSIYPSIHSFYFLHLPTHLVIIFPFTYCFNIPFNHLFCPLNHPFIHSSIHSIPSISTHPPIMLPSIPSSSIPFIQSFHPIQSHPIPFNFPFYFIRIQSNFYFCLYIFIMVSLIFLGNSLHLTLPKNSLLTWKIPSYSGSTKYAQLSTITK